MSPIYYVTSVDVYAVDSVDVALAIGITISTMKRWSIFALSLWIVCAALVISSVNLGRLLPSTDPFLNLQIAECNKAPCVQGVIPGVTSWYDATAHLARDAGSIMTENNIDVGVDTLTHTTFTADTSGDKVDSISIHFVDSHFSLGLLLSHYGTPCKLRVYSSGGIQMIYPQLIAVVDISRSSTNFDTEITADTKVRELDFSGGINSCELEKSDPDNVYHDKFWRGFMDLDKYYENN